MYVSVGVVSGVRGQGLGSQEWDAQAELRFNAVREGLSKQALFCACGYHTESSGSGAAL